MVGLNRILHVEIASNVDAQKTIVVQLKMTREIEQSLNDILGHFQSSSDVENRI